MGITNWIEIGRMDELGRMDTPAHRLDARAKAAVTVVFILIVMSFPRYEISALTPFWLYPISLLALGQIPVRDIARKLMIAAPFALVVGLFNPLLDRQPVAAIGSFTITGGWISFTSIMIRFALTVGAALALIACTGMYRLGAGLERLGVPRLFVMQLLFLYRYIFVIAEEGIKMLRGVGFRSGGGSIGLRVYGPLTGHLLLRSMDRAERIYRAMVARGFNGEIRLAQPASFQWRDTVFVIGWTAFFLLARTWNLATGLGSWITRGA